MEFSESQIAKLVLGYLKSERCKPAFKSFLKCSPQLRDVAETINRKNYFITRVGGLSLVDYLTEYAIIYTIIQERLEFTQYYVENRCKHNLVEQLLYLIDKGNNCRIQTPSIVSRCSTPIPSFQKVNIPDSCSEISRDNINGSSPEDMPGNTWNRQKHTRQSQEDNESNDSKHEFSLLTQTLLESHELHEKIAENINIVRNSTDGNANIEETSSNASQAVDTAIKAIVQRTENDPVYEKLINEIIGISNDCKENLDNAIKNASPCKSQKGIPKQQAECTAKFVQKNVLTTDEKIEHLNTEAVQSLIAAASSCPKPAVPNCPIVTQVQPDIQQSLSINTNSGDVILFDGNLDNYLKSSNSGANMNLVRNQNNLLMLQPQNNGPPTSIIQTIVEPNKSCFILSNQSLVNRGIQPKFNVGDVISEQDILKMPTVILCDEKLVNRPLLLPRIPTSSTMQTNILNTAPQNTNITQTHTEYITMYKGQPCPNESCNVYQTVVPTNTKLANLKVDIIKPANKPPSNVVTLPKETNIIKPLEPPNLLDALPSLTPDNKLHGPKRNITPKSGSHVRVLDFNFASPTKDVTDSKGKLSDSKKPPIKCVQALFGKPEVNGVIPDANCDRTGSANAAMQKPRKTGDSWDADLRALTSFEKRRAPSPKRKKRPPARNRKRLRKPVVKPLDDPDAKKIEESLVKTENNVPIKAPAKKKYTPSTQKGTRKSARLATLSPGNVFNISNSLESINETQNAEDTNNISLKEVSLNSGNENEDFEISNETTLNLRNLNLEQKAIRKCNILSNAVRKETKLTTVKEIKPLEFIADGTNKLILSPSKLNANKRTLVEVDNRSLKTEINAPEAIAPAEVPTVAEIDANVIPEIEPEKPVQVESIEKAAEPTADKFVTPEMYTAATSHPITAKRNITTILETPMKFDALTVPKTPGIFSPSNTIDTPMTKMFKEHIHDLDLASIPSPKFSLTPMFPITPFIEENPFAERRTDYSTSSSYYQPSDTEQNKSLEQLIHDEIRRPGVKRINENRPVIENITCEDKTSNIVQKQLEPCTDVNKVIAEKMLSTNRSFAGHKNLNLVKKSVDSLSSSDSDSSSKDSSSDAYTEFSDCCSDATVSDTSEKTNKTVIENSKKSSANESGKCKPRLLANTLSPKFGEGPETIPVKLKNTERIQEIIERTALQTQSYPTPLDHESYTSKQKVILSELEEKRQRIVAKMKEDAQAGNRSSKSVKTERKIPAKRKSISGTRVSEAHKKATGVTSKKPVNLKTAPAKASYCFVQNVEPFEIVETELLGSSSPTPVSAGNKNLLKEPHPLQRFHRAFESVTSTPVDKGNVQSIEEAEKLVSGLKEMGILVIPKNAPKKTTKKVVSETSAKAKDKAKPTTTKRKKAEPKPRKPKKPKQTVTKPAKPKTGVLQKLLENEKRPIELDLSKKDCNIATNANTDESNDEKAAQHKDIAELPLNLSEVLTFDVQVYEEETLHLRYDEKNKSGRTLSDYNFELIKKGISAQLYDDYGNEIEKIMTATPLHFVLEYPTPKNEMRERLCTGANERRREFTIEKKNLPPDKPATSHATKAVENGVLTQISKKNDTSLTGVAKTKTHAFKFSKTGKKTIESAVDAIKHHNQSIGDTYKSQAVSKSDTSTIGVSSEAVIAAENSTSKRKATMEMSDPQTKKSKPNPCELLKQMDMDMDSFLNKVHG